MPTTLETPASNALYASIVGTVAATLERRLTVQEIAARLEQEPQVVGSCIALHRYLRQKACGPVTDVMLTFPMPTDLTVPDLDEEIDEKGLGL